VLVGWYLQIRVFGVAPRASRLKAIENENSRLKRPHPEYENCPKLDIYTVKTYNNQ